MIGSGIKHPGSATLKKYNAGVRESYVNLCSNVDDKLKIYRENFERAYILATESFYKIQVRKIWWRFAYCL
jgi:hypothetical protein